MQSSRRPSNGRPSGLTPPSADACAGTVLDVIPAVVRFIRRSALSHGTLGLSVPQFRTLALLSHSPNASLSSVAENVGSSLPAASRMIGGLVSKKLVVRQGSKSDRRQLSLALTPRGAAVFEAVRDRARGDLAEKLTALAPDSYDRICAGLALLGEAFGTDAGPSLTVGERGRALAGSSE